MGVNDYRYFSGISFLLLIFISTPQFIQSQQTFHFQKMNLLRQGLQQSFNESHMYQFDIGALKDYVEEATINKSNSTISFQVPGQDKIDLFLQPYDVRGANYKLTVGTPSGVITMPRTKNKTYRGYTKQDQRDVRFTLDQGFMSGIIDLGEDQLIFEPVSDFTDKRERNDRVVIYLLSETEDHPSGLCATQHKHAHQKNKAKGATLNAQRTQILACKELEVAIANDFMMYQDYGNNVANVENQNLSVINNVETNYDDEFADDLQFVVVEIFVPTCSSCDEVSTSLDINDVLSSFRNWGPNGFSNTHDVATFWSPRDFFDPQIGNGVIGLAYIGVICGFARYNVCEDYSSNPNSLRVLQAHEMGHNFDARHDPSGSGTIMAPSVNNTTSWSTASINDINAHIASIDCLGPCSAGAPPSASFSSDQVNGCTPFEVSFSDDSSNEPTSWSWTFEGGTPSSSSDQNPFVTYNSPGVFNVTLEVTNAFGNDIVTQQNLIEVGSTPTADFTYDVFEFDVSFTNFSDNFSDVFWDFGDGFSSTDINPSHTYQEDGLYQVVLTTTNDCGFDDRTIFVEIITSPIADFSVSQTSGCESFTVQFNNESSQNADFYQWTFEGGNPATSISQNPVVTYTSPGLYEVVLFVSNSAGSDELIMSNLIEVMPLPSALFSYSENGFVVSFNAVQGENDLFNWDFGDGDSGSGVNAIHTYQSAGVYDVTLITSNSCGNDTLSQTITLQGAPLPNFMSNAISGCSPLQVQFMNSSTGSVDTYAWVFEGGNPAASSEENPIVTFAQPGSYDVQLTVSNSFGTESLTVENYITILPDPESVFDFTIQGSSVTFSNQSMNGEDYIWDFGDGNVSNLISPSHTYDEDGIYEVSLIVLNSCGFDTSTLQVPIATPPQAAFGVAQTSGCAPLLVSFTNQSSSNATEFVWNFEGGIPSTSTEANPVVSYTQPGTYSVELEAISDGGINILVQTDLITVLPDPVASFSIGNVDELSVSFQNSSSFGNVFFWDFGDGNTSVQPNPVHVFNSFDSYQVVLVTTNTCGSDTSMLQLELTTQPIVQISASSTNGCAPFEVQFEDKSINDPTSWSWSFPGGIPSSSTQQNPSIVYPSPGMYKVELIASNSAGSNELVLEDYIQVGSIPEVGFDFEVSGSEVLFTNTTINADQIIWHFGNGISSNQDQTRVIYESDGTYDVMLIAFNACGSDTITQQVAITITDIDDFSLKSIQVYPNPTSGIVNIDMTGYDGIAIRIEAINSVGQIILTHDVDQSAVHLQPKLELNSFESGVYYLKISYNESYHIYPIIVQK